jgi:DDE superfamily endonuclease/Phage integrase family/Phage integrase, N-terminal SAM-like domain
MDDLLEFEQYMAHLGEGLGHADRHAGLLGYCTGLMSPLARKSVEPMAAHVDPLKVRSRHQSLHHFVADANWSDEQMLLRVCQWVVPLMDLGDGGWWIIDDTGFPKQGRHSVGVARQYCGMLGKQDNCQVAVSVSLACEAASLPVAWQHYRRSPDTLSAEEVQHYLLHLLRERHLARSSVNQYSCACRFLYGTVLGLDGNAFQIPLAPAPQRLPEILSRQELARLFAAAVHQKARTFLMLAYGTGLRLSQLCRLRAQHIDSHADRMCIRVQQGKGGKDRYVPLSEDVLQLLRTWWRAQHPRAREPGHHASGTSSRPRHEGASAGAGLRIPPSRFGASVRRTRYWRS